jgi:hypothetical protein
MKKIISTYFILCSLCISQLAFTQHNNNILRGDSSTRATLTIDLVSFKGNFSHDKAVLEWVISKNEIADRFDVERSDDGVRFAMVALVFTSEKNGNENYMFYENLHGAKKVYYRLKMYDKSGAINYSKTLTFQAKAQSGKEIKIATNAMTDKLGFSLLTAQQTRKFTIYTGTCRCRS